jgi:Bacterial Ig-like domain (group 3)
VFHDGNTDLGTSALNSTGVATLRIDTLAVGAHSLMASYEGDGKFGGSTSATVTINIANADCSLGASPSTATVKAGLSTQFMLTVAAAGGFADNVTFTCAPVTGISCSFKPTSVTPTNGTASTALTVTTSASVSRYVRASDAGAIRPLWFFLKP